MHVPGFPVSNVNVDKINVYNVPSVPWFSPVLAQNITYTPFGALSSLQNGCVGTGCTNAQETYSYNNRLQASQIQLGVSGNTGEDYTLGYNYSLPGGATPPGCPVQAQGSGNNGNVIGYSYSDSVNPSYSNSALFVYDSVNRLACAQATGNSTYNLAFSYTQDGSSGQFGNMTCSLNSSTSGPCAQYSFNGANQITGYTYDGAGDMISGGGHTYQYDAEARLVSVDGGTTESYVYNAFGQQVRLIAPNFSYTWDHLYDPAGQCMGRWSNNAWWASGVFHLGGRLFAVYFDQTYFIHLNNLGSTMMTTTSQGTVDGDTQLYPWGQDWLGGTPEWHFAAFQYGDSATGLYPTLNRQYANGEGRWLTPDPGGEKVVKLDDPQTWNMYAYTRNNPTTFTDATGLCNDGTAGHDCAQPPPDPATVKAKADVQSAFFGGTDSIVGEYGERTQVPVLSAESGDLLLGSILGGLGGGCQASWKTYLKVP